MDESDTHQTCRARVRIFILKSYWLLLVGRVILLMGDPSEFGF